MVKSQNSRREFLRKSGLFLTFPFESIIKFNEMTDTFHNYEEALKNPLEVKILSFSFNNSYHPYTKSLPDERIKTLINLEKLFISGFKGEYLNLPDEIRELKKLNEISIYSENLIEIPKVIWSLNSLTNLHLEINSLKNSDINLSNLANLESFGIKLHKTEILPDSLFENANLTHFYIQSDDLRIIPNHFDKLHNLISLALNCQNLNIIPSTIGSLKKLKNIDFYNKTAKSIGINFEGLEELNKFRWGQSLFFPLPLIDAINLEVLTLDVSYFETINAKELHFKNLNQLKVTFSKLDRMPKCFETLQGIQHLILDYNNFRELEFDFRNLNNLNSLSFRRCENFDKIDMKKFCDSLKTVKNLKYLETPTLSKQQNILRKEYNFEFKWIEE